LKRFFLAIVLLFFASNTFSSHEISKVISIKLEKGTIQALNVIKDDYSLLKKYKNRYTNIPSLTLNFYLKSNTLISTSSELIRAQGVEETAWNFIASENGQFHHGIYHFPLALIQKGQNCTHHGIIKLDSKNKTYKLEVKQETCKYLKFDLTIKGKAQIVKKDSSIINPSKYRKIVRPISDLSESFTTNHFTKEKKDITLLGVIKDDQVYSSFLLGRDQKSFGELNSILPSFSLAKFMLSSLSLSELKKVIPSIGDDLFCKYLSQVSCKSSWGKVTFNHLSNMTTGHYYNSENMYDEKNKFSHFFGSYLETVKMTESLRVPYQEPPGKTFVYQSTNSFLLFLSIQEVFKIYFNNKEFDLYTYLKEEVYDQFGKISSTSLLRSWKNLSLTGESSGSGLGGYGLFFKESELNLIHNLLTINSTYKVQENQAGSPVYKHGIWYKEIKIEDSCTITIPHLMGFGGITFALYPNGISYFEFGDSGHFNNLEKVSKSIDKIRSLCPSEMYASKAPLSLKRSLY